MNGFVGVWFDFRKNDFGDKRIQSFEHLDIKGFNFQFSKKSIHVFIFKKSAKT